MRRGLQVIVSTFGVIAVVFGSLSVLLGSDIIPLPDSLGSRELDSGAQQLAASIDSELRYYGAWYVLGGVLALRTVPRVESEGFTIRLICAALVLGAAGRLISIAVAGAPHPLFLVLLALELLFPAAVVPWQAALARRRA